VSGSPKVNTDKDGIFGRFLNVWDGSQFRRGKGDTSGNLSIVQLPVVNRIPIAIHSIPGIGFVSPVRGIALFTDVVYTVPANTILHIAQSYLIVLGGAVGYFYHQTPLLGQLYIFQFQAAPAVGIPYILNQDLYYDAGTVFNVTCNVTGAGTSYVAFLNGFLIPKT